MVNREWGFLMPMSACTNREGWRETASLSTATILGTTVVSWWLASHTSFHHNPENVWGCHISSSQYIIVKNKFNSNVLIGNHYWLINKTYSLFCYFTNNFSCFFIIISRCQHRSPWPSLTTHHYHPLLPGGLQSYILYRYRAVVYRF